jgi:hypothetical protein
MSLTPEQLAAVQHWAEEGATLNDVQQRLKQEFGLTITYLDARLLLLDLKVKLKDKPREEPKAAEPAAASDAPTPVDGTPEATTGGVSVTVDELAIPGAMVSGKVTFTDGKIAGWFIDQMGRLGMKAPEPGYKPPAEDVPVFQQELDRLLANLGY